MFSSAMAKKSYNQQCKSEKVQVGCMSGLMRLLDFRRHPKLLSDGRVKRDPKGSEDIHGSMPADDDKECSAELSFAGRASIKTLMEEEMASQPLKQRERNVSGICVDDIDLNLATSLIEIYRNHSKGQEIKYSVESETSEPIGKERNSDPSTHINLIRSNIQKALEDVAEAVIRHQSANAKYLSSGSTGEARSKEFVDALQLLSSNKELFFMLIQDPSSRLLECLQNLYMSLGSTKLDCEGYDGETELQVMTHSPDQSVTSPSKLQRRHNSFLMEDKLVMRKPSNLNDNSRGFSRIVILKPNPTRSHTSLISSSATSSPLSNHINFHGQEDGDKSNHHFSLRELKRRLRLAVNNSVKDNQLNSMSSTLHKAEADSSKQLPVSSMLVTSTDSSDCKIAEEASMVDMKTVPEDSVSGTRNDATHGVGSFSYEKAKMYLIERLNSQGEDSSKIVQKSESFERLISLPENDTFSSNHCTQEKVDLAHECTSALDLHTIEQEDGSANPNPEMLHQGTVSAHISNLTKQTLAELNIYHGDDPLSESTISHELNNKGVEIMHDIVENPPLCTESESETLWERVGEKSQDQCSSEESQSTNVLLEVALPSPDDPVDDQGNHSPSEAVQSVKPSVLTCPCFPENTNDREEKLSPQSVLDSVVGDISSPLHKSRKRDELSKPTSRVLFKELDTTSASPALWNVPQLSILDDKSARVSFIKVVLEASGLLSEEISHRWYIEESPLHISVLAEVGNWYCLTDDAVLLFDCVEAVLLKIRDNFFGVDPCFAFLKYSVRPAPAGTNLVHEVAKDVDAVVSNEFPNTLDQVIMKDLETGSWMDLRHDAEGVAVDLWDGFFDDLLEEMIFDLWLSECSS